MTANEVDTDRESWEMSVFRWFGGKLRENGVEELIRQKGAGDGTRTFAEKEAGKKFAHLFTSRIFLDVF